jgi:carnitine 3-dehydrogenase
MQALKAGDEGRGWGAGKLLAEFEAHLWKTSPKPKLAVGDEPLRLLEVKVHPAWVDYNGHMTEHRYLHVFGDTTDALLRLIGSDLDYVAGGHSYYTVETHIRHLGEAKLGQALYSTTQLLSHDEKRLHVFSRIHDAATGDLIATAEQMLLHVDSKAGKSCPAAPQILENLSAIAAKHSKLPAPDGAGRSVGQKR